MNEPFKAGIMDIRGKAVQIYVTERGDWISKEPAASASTRDELRNKLMNLTKMATTKLSIPVTLHVGTRYGTPALIDTRLMGRHGGNGNILFRRSDRDVTEQETGYHENWYREMSATEKNIFLKLEKEADAAVARFDEYAKPMKIRAGDVVDKALAAVVAEEAKHG